MRRIREDNGPFWIESLPYPQTPEQLGLSGPGQNTVSVRYIPDGRRSKGVLSQGQAIVLIRGPEYTLGINNILGVLGGGSQNTTNPTKIKPGK
jgi:hypothetical protein